MLKSVAKFMKVEYLMYGAWAVALLATVGSLGLSEILQLQPCVLCWVQRIFMYPLAIILPIGILRKDPSVAYYALPLSLAGMAVAGYQSLLQWGIIPKEAAPCVNGVSCADAQINLLGFITIPFGSFLCFAVIGAALILVLRHEKNTRLAKK